MQPPSQQPTQQTPAPQQYDLTEDDTVEYPEVMPEQAADTQDSQATVEYPEEPQEETLEYSDAESALHTYMVHRAQRQGEAQDFLPTGLASETLKQFYAEALEDDLAEACRQHEADIRAFTSRVDGDLPVTEPGETWTKE